MVNGGKFPSEKVSRLKMIEIYNDIVQYVSHHRSVVVTRDIVLGLF